MPGLSVTTLDATGTVGTPDQHMRVPDQMNSLEHIENDNWSRVREFGRFAW